MQANDTTKYSLLIEQNGEMQLVALNLAAKSTKRREDGTDCHYIVESTQPSIIVLTPDMVTILTHLVRGAQAAYGGGVYDEPGSYSAIEYMQALLQSTP